MTCSDRVDPLYDPKNPDNHAGGIGVAVADRPNGPYADHLGHALIADFYNDAQPIDQFVFEADGQWYIVYGGWRRCNLAQLNDDFTALVPFEDGETFNEITPKGYVEGPTMFKRGDLWYFLWSEGGWGNDTYHVVYATSASILGPWQRQGTILQSDETIATGAGHNSVMRTPGSDDWYIVYHRRPDSERGRDHRVTCVDKPGVRRQRKDPAGADDLERSGRQSDRVTGLNGPTDARLGWDAELIEVATTPYC